MGYGSGRHDIITIVTFNVVSALAIASLSSSVTWKESPCFFLDSQHVLGISESHYLESKHQPGAQRTHFRVGKA